MSLIPSLFSDTFDYPTFLTSFDSALGNYGRRQDGRNRRSGNEDNSLIIPQFDLYETDDEVKMQVELPGANKDEIKVETTPTSLSVSGEFKREKESPDQSNLRYSERTFGRFRRTVSLPASVETDNVKAKFENGILTVCVPKGNEKSTKTISIE